ncbi:hypothetical protein EDD85DRAFT_796039 [Armillaria nabsnona]|nr:hypothetical protein EDD85DRAFT_796039 [Armillaria nabsnona]
MIPRDNCSSMHHRELPFPRALCMSHRPATALQAGLLKTGNLSLLNSRSIREQPFGWPDHALAYDIEHRLCLQCTQNNFLKVSQTHESISISPESPVPTSSNPKARLDINTATITPTPQDKVDATSLISSSHSLWLFSSLTTVRQLPPRRTRCILPLLLHSNHMHQASKEVLDFIDATDELIPQMTGQLNLLRPNRLAFIGDAQPPSPASVTITSRSTTKSTSRSSSATPISSSSSTASSTFPYVHLLAGRHPRYQSFQFTPLSLSAARSWLLRRIYFSFSGVGNGAARGFKNTAINARMASDYVIQVLHAK